MIRTAGQLRGLASRPIAIPATPSTAKSHALSAIRFATVTQLSRDRLTLGLQRVEVLPNVVYQDALVERRAVVLADVYDDDAEASGPHSIEGFGELGVHVGRADYEGGARRQPA
jgi:hypothetical protein